MAGAMGGADRRWVMVSDYDYAIDVVNKSGGAQPISISINVYEDD